jgi:hypothetical protein
VVAGGDDQDGAMVAFVDVRDSGRQGAKELLPVACPELLPATSSNLLPELQSPPPSLTRFYRDNSDMLMPAIPQTYCSPVSALFSSSM